MSKKEQAIKQALASVSLEGLNVSDTCIKKVIAEKIKKQKILIKK